MLDRFKSRFKSRFDYRKAHYRMMEAFAKEGYLKPEYEGLYMHPKSEFAIKVEVLMELIQKK